MHICIHVYVYIYIYVNKYISIYTYVSIQKYAYMYTYFQGGEDVYNAVRCRSLCAKEPYYFCKRATYYRALLRKETYKDEAFYASLPPCTSEPR